ncbi:MAG TPA: 4-hydroxyphenylacetate 3-hydroxylase N-terminal domain-containing protein [Dehalococcoidia bacterium]|nr:4-hydroxyphenylacetate 3-hydroxylase N-terminal domain-containing protein [Dehalococcoidia bacterium]
MRTGAEYEASLRDGRRVWIVGEGPVEDVSTHPASRAMVEHYKAWYDRHIDPAWQEVLFAPDETGTRRPVAYTLPRSSDDLRRMGKFFSATLFLSAGNVTHTPAYGNLIALGILHTAQEYGRSAEQVANAEAYRQSISATGRFLTFSSGGATIGHRLREDPEGRPALRIVKETDTGLVLRGQIGMHTSPAYAEDVYVGVGCGVDYESHRVTFVVPVNAPGVTVVCRKPAARYENAFMAPLSSRYDELDGQMWLDDVFVPWDRVFFVPVPGQPDTKAPDTIAYWLFWHQLYAWLAKAEFTLGLALACTDAMGLRENQPSLEHLVDLMEGVQTVRSCQTAAETDPEFTSAGYCMPRQVHVAAGSLAMLKARQHLTETLRILPGSSMVVAPSDADIAAPQMAAGFEEAFGGGRYTALQRSALLQLAWDHVSSGLDGRESAFELHANGGASAWRVRLRRHFDDYNRLANAILDQLDIDMPPVDLSDLGQAQSIPRRVVTPPAEPPAFDTGSTRDEA